MTFIVGLVGSLSVLLMESSDGSLDPKLRPSELVAAAKVDHPPENAPLRLTHMVMFEVYMEQIVDSRLPT